MVVHRYLYHLFIKVDSCLTYKITLSWLKRSFEIQNEGVDTSEDNLQVVGRPIRGTEIEGITIIFGQLK